MEVYVFGKRGDDGVLGLFVFEQMGDDDKVLFIWLNFGFTQNYELCTWCALLLFNTVNT